MDTSELEQFFSSAWASTSKACVEKIQDREDRKTLRGFRNYDDILEHAINDPDEPISDLALRELSMIRPRLVELRDFSPVFAQKLGPELDPALFWGLLGVMLTVAAQMDEVDATRRLAQMLKKLSRNVDILRGHTTSTNLSNKEKEAVFETFVALTRFFGDAVQFLRDDEHFVRCRSPDQDPWRRLNDIYANTTHDIEESLKTVEKMAVLTGKHDNMTWLYTMMALSPRSWKDEATLPCVMLPPSRGSKFFDRDDAIEKIEDHFSRSGSEAFRSVALYGMGGVGKTTVAMKYAEKQNARRTVNAVLWVEGESEMKIKQSFTEIAKRLQLPNFVPQSHDDNRLVVMNWLQQTKAKWLIIYDNVENFDVLHAHWPNSTARGHALITTRNTALAYEPTEAGIEVLPWDTQTGSKFLLHLLSGHISAELLANQSQSALELSERLSGHALALAKMGGVIHRRSWTIQQLVEVYDRQPDFKNGIGPVWQVSFQNLSPFSSALLSIFAFCSPDNIPQSLLEPDNLRRLPESLQWSTDTEKLSQAIEELQTLSLVKKDRESRTLSIHRLIQSHFLQFLGAVERQKAHDMTSELLYLAFPQRQANLHGKWDRCSLFIQHIVALKDGFRMERKRSTNVKACREFCEVAVTCSRFLLEQHEFTEMEDMCVVTKDALSTRDEEDLMDMSSALQSYLGQMYLRCGLPKKALVCLLESLRIRLLDENGDLQEVSWSEHNIAQACLANGDLEAGFGWHQRCRKTWERWGDLQPKTVNVSFDQSMQASMARCLLYMGKVAESRRLLEQPLKEFLGSVSDNWAEAAYATFILGRIEMAEKNFSAAEARFMEAQTLWLKGDKARTNHFNGASMYRMGCCALDGGKVEAAIKHITDAMVVTYIHKDYMVGEHARCLYKLSQALYQDGGKELEAEIMLQEAESLYFTWAENQGKTPTEEDYDQLVYVLWR